uniref:Uncharacterized protein n=1 Tax=Panagrolaimus superbus TaxID=310955 RepID=A0A914YFI1_9BILA
MFGSNGERIIISSGDFVVRYPTYENVLFFRIQTNSTSDGSVLFCFETTEKLKSQHYECDIGQCGMKFYFKNDAIYLNHDGMNIPFHIFQMKQ